MNALEERTRALKARGKKALVPFFTAGFPDEETFLRLVADAAGAAGCPVVEVGVPFSDPIADGPVIQESSKAALERGITLRRTLELARRAAERTRAALVLMGYLNPLLRMGVGAFARAAREAGVAGVIVPDLPVEESGGVRRTLAGEGIVLVDLLAPTSGPERIAAAAGEARGFLYLVSITGVTGARSPEAADTAAFVARVRAHTDLPLYVGFGIKNPELAAAAAKSADGVIAGSALIRCIREAPSREAAVDRVRALLEDMQAAMEAAEEERAP